MKTGNVTLSVVIKGANGQHVAREFVAPRDLQTFVEGREGSSFTLRIRNDNPFRILAMLSVDGLSVIGGERATLKSRGFVVAANTTFDVPGWKLDAHSAAEFFFAGMKEGRDESYLVQMGHDDENKGIIGLIAFGEERPRVRPPAGIALAARFGSPLRSAVGARTLSMEATKSAAGPAMLAASSASVADHEPTSVLDDGPEQTLGTGFGKAVRFETSNVSFRRGDLVAQMEIRYDDRRGLKKHGIDVDRSVRRPQAFDLGGSGDGCAPPPGWTR